MAWPGVSNCILHLGTWGPGRVAAAELRFPFGAWRTAMNFSSELLEVARQPERDEDLSFSFRADPDRDRPKFNNVPPDLTSAEERNDVIPGRGDLRISLT